MFRIMSFVRFFEELRTPKIAFDIYCTTKLLNAKVKNSQIILRIVLPIPTKFLQKSQICRALLQEVAKQSVE